MSIIKKQVCFLMALSIMLSSLIVPMGSAMAEDVPAVVYAAGDGWNDTFENITRVSEYNDVRIDHDVSLNTSIYWKDWVKQGIVVDTDTASDSDHAMYSCVITDNGIYKMWYSGSNDGGVTFKIIYATSTDGENWNKQGVVLSPGGVYDSNDIRMSYVLKDSGIYKMWYAGGDGSNYRILYATSPDGITWAKQGIALDIGGSQEDVFVSSPTVLIEGGTYKMWYTGYDGSGLRIFHATSTDGITWVKQGRVIDYGSSSYEATGVYFPSVIRLGGIYNMWYSGRDTGSRLTILYATSIDGINWDKKGLDINYGDVVGEDQSVSQSHVIIDSDGSLKHWYSGTNWAPVNKYRLLLATMNPRSFEPMSWDKQGVAVDIGTYSQDSTWTTAPGIIKDGSTYKMWYTGYDGSNNRVLYADSSDGVTWNKQGLVLDIGTSGATDDAHISSPFVMKEGATYKMWYGGHDGSNYRMHYATSADGMTWSKQGVATGLNLGTGGSYDDFGLSSPSIIKEDGIYKMWYFGLSSSTSGDVIYATSADGLSWTKQGIAVPNGGTYDMLISGEPSVLKLNGEYHMWYRGAPSFGVSYVLYASSSDGLTWTKQGQAVVPGAPGDSDDDRLIAPRVLLDSDGYIKMWYTGHDGSAYRIHYAKTPFHIEFDTWDKQNLAFDLSAVGDDRHMNLGVYVIKDDGIYKMWYTGVDLSMTYRVCYATSTDGIAWTKLGSVVPLGSSGSSDDRHTGYPYVIKEDSIYKMWYDGHDGTEWKIHYATSTDGITWTKYGVVIPLGGLPGGTDDKHTAFKSVLKSNGEYRMFYGGSDTSNIFRIHLATSPDGIAWTKIGVIVDIGSPGDRDENSAACPNIIEIDDLYYMFYTGSSSANGAEILYATSSDGDNWTKHGLSLPQSSSGTDDTAVTNPSVIIDTDGYAKMWYAGNTAGQYRIHWATMPLSYFAKGNITSESISLPAGKIWDSLDISKSEPSAENNITVTILDVVTGDPISGFVNMAGTNIDISGLDSTAYPSIRLHGIISGNGSASPELHDWNVNWTDGTSIASSIDAVSPYLHNTGPLPLTATSSDAEYVEFWYRFASDNSTWGAWSQYSNDTSDASWTSSFTFPGGEGYYEFYSRAGNVTSGVYEVAPAAADALAMYDIISPVSWADSIIPYWHNTSPLALTATAFGSEYVEFWYHFASDNSTWSAWSQYSNDTSDASWTSSFTFPDGEGYYEFYSRAGNVTSGAYEVAPGVSDTSVGYDITLPSSQVDVINPYWNFDDPLVINATANDTGVGIKQVELFYRSSLNNLSWSAWSSYGNATISPYFWNFSYTNAGFYQFYTIATDKLDQVEVNLGNADEVVALGVIEPVSDMLPLSEYYWMSIPLTLSATAVGSEYVEFWYSFSSDDSTWGAWSIYSNDTTYPFSMNFDAADGEGYYQFYSRSGNATTLLYESVSTVADVEGCYKLLPEILDLTSGSPSTGDDLTATCVVQDLIGIDDVYLNFRYELTTGLGSWHNDTMSIFGLSNYNLELSMPDNALEFIYYISVCDVLGNWNSTAQISLDVIDNDIPEVHALVDDKSVPLLYFSSNGSMDNIGISTYSWNFTYDGQERVFAGSSFSYEFLLPGSYLITLNIIDSSGNSATDRLTIKVEGEDADPSSIEADAGSNKDCICGTIFQFDGSGSSGDLDISNYTWTFTYDDEEIKLYGENPTFTFMDEGTYIVSLNASDIEGNWDTDSVIIEVLAEGDDGGFDWTWLILLLIIVIVLALILIMASRRKKDKEPVRIHAQPAPPIAQVQQPPQAPQQQSPPPSGIAPSPPPPPSDYVAPPPPISPENQEMLDKLELRHAEGHVSEETYQMLKEKYSKP